MTKLDAGIKFFHANATIRHTKNLITCLENPLGVIHSGHQDKAQILWEAYKDRLDQSEFSSMLLNLDALLPSHPNLSSLEDPFTAEEIDHVVPSLPTDKSPGPDGFNTNFIKKCWPIIKQDFYNLCHEFHSRNVCLQSLDSFYIALVPKIDGPTKVIDFRPISLLNISMKIITKLLANRLQKVI